MITWSRKNRRLAMWRVLSSVALSVLLFSCSPCKKLPDIERSYSHKIHFDSLSIHTLDSIDLKISGDTVYRTRYRYITSYKEKKFIDTVRLQITKTRTIKELVKVEVPVRGFYYSFGRNSFWVLITVVVAILLLNIKKMFSFSLKIIKYIQKWQKKEL